jgi:hypothetical protein
MLFRLIPTKIDHLLLMRDLRRSRFRRVSRLGGIQC